MRIFFLAAAATIGLAACDSSGGGASNSFMPAGSEWAILSVEGKDTSKSNRHYLKVSDKFVSFSGGCNAVTNAAFPALGPAYATKRNAASTLMGCLQENEDTQIGEILERADNVASGPSANTVIVTENGRTLMELRRKPNQPG